MDYRLVLSDLKIINLQFLLTVDNDVRELSRDLGGFPELTPGQKNLFDQSIVDIQ